MIDRLLPRSIDEPFRGSRIAVWMLLPIALVTFYRGGVHVFLPDSGAQSIATIPLDSFSPESASTVIAFVAQWGWLQILWGCLYLLVVFRYRALTPLMYVLLLAEYLGRNAIDAFKPVVTVETPPGANLGYAMITLSLIGLVLSLRWKSETSVSGGK